MRDASSRRFRATGCLVLLSLAAGVGYAAMLMGGRPLHPSDLGWMKGDPVEHYLGWLFYQQTPDNSFPLTWSDRLGYPYGGYLSLTDPAILILLGWVRHLIPPGLQFFGWLFAFNAALLFFWGWKLIAEMAEQLPLKSDAGTKLLACLTGALLLLWLPEFGVAATGNYCSQFQWPVVASLYFLLRADSGGNPWRWCWPFWLLIFIAALMHPYAGAITALVGFGGWLRLLLERYAIRSDHPSRHSRGSGNPLRLRISGVGVAPRLRGGDEGDSVITHNALAALIHQTAGGGPLSDFLYARRA